MKAFLTGSQVIGEPTEESDVDLVIRMSDSEARTLAMLSDQPPNPAVVDHYGMSGMHTIRFGKLNVLLCTTDEYWAAWKMATNKCLEIKRKPTRSERVEIFRSTFAQMGLQ